MAIGRDIYIDTRLMLRKLETLYPEGKLGATNSFEQGFEDMLEEFIIDGGPFVRTSGCIPVSAPFVNDEVWMKDRFDGSGGMFTRQMLVENRAWCISQLRLFFGMLEKMLADGREWILSGSKPGLAEVHAGWVYDWALNMAGDMRDDSGESTADMQKVLSSQEFPKAHAWIKRWREVTVNAEKTNHGAGSMSAGIDQEDNAVRTILEGRFCEPDGLAFDQEDVLGLSRGQQVRVSPVDFGFTHQDTGKLIGLTKEEAVIEIEVPDGRSGKVRLHYPRINFKIVPVA